MSTWSPAVLQDAPLLQSLLQGLPDAFILADTDGIVRLWNASATRLFGYEAAEALGVPLDDLIVPERFRATHDAGFARAIATGQLRAGTRVLRTRAQPKDGRRMYVDFTFGLLKDGSGAVVAVYATGRDATEAHLQASGATAAPASPAPPPAR